MKADETPNNKYSCWMLIELGSDLKANDMKRIYRAKKSMYFEEKVQDLYKDRSRPTVHRYEFVK